MEDAAPNALSHKVISNNKKSITKQYADSENSPRQYDLKG